MKYSIEVIREDRENYFLACHEDMRFLFRRIHASTLINSPNSDEMDKFEVVRNDGIIIAGECYNLCGRLPVFLINYSELAAYNPMRNASSPHENLYAQDFLPGDMVFSNVDGHGQRGKAFASVLAFLETRNALVRDSLQIITAHYSFIRKVENNQDVLGLRTFIVPPYF